MTTGIGKMMMMMMMCYDLMCVQNLTVAS